MHRHPDTLRADRAGACQHEQTPPFRASQAAGDIDALRPIRAVLSATDYWELQEHRRRCEDVGGELFQRLAYLIRAKSSDAFVIDAKDLPPDIVTGAARVTFSLDQRRPETRTLFHWDYTDRARRRLPVGSFLGVTLLGMAAGQRAPLLDGKGVAGEVHVLAVHAQATPEAETCG